MKVAVIIPAYNEEKMIGTVVRQVKQYIQDIIVVNDGSWDKTKEEALSAGATVLTHMVNCGQGAAIQTGLDYAYQKGYDVMVTFDADGQFLAQEIHDMIAPIQEGNVQFVKGSRFLGKKSHMELYRRLCLWAAIQFTKWTTGKTFSDVHIGFMAFSRTCIPNMRITQYRMAHGSEILSHVSKKCIPYVEIPITVLYTDYSRAKGQKFTDYFKILKDLFLGHFK